MLIGKNITKKIQNTEILKDVSVSVKEGKITCILGPSGGGKSTILSCLALLSPPNMGEISVDDETFTFCSGKEQYERFPYPKVTVVFQGLFLWPHMKNLENLMMPIREQRIKNSNFDEIIEAFNIKHILDKYPNECSGGEKQRVALARQILLNPKYLLLDEVTSALDIEQVKVVGNLLKKLRGEGKGILMATHMINFAKSIGDYFYFVDKGAVVEEGEISNLEHPMTARLNNFLQIYT